MPSLQQLRYLAALADTLNFSRAAEICHVTQPTLSLQLKELEAKLGAVLVERTRARVLLTPTGTEIAARARAVLASVEDIREVARRDRPEAGAEVLRLGVVQTVGAYVLSVAMPDLRARLPQIRVKVREDRRDALLRQLSEGQHDAVLLSEEVDLPGVICAPLLVEPLQLVMPADHPLAGKARIAPEDLAGETVLTMERGHRLQDQILKLCQRVGAIHAVDYEGSTLDTLRQMVAIGMGVTLLPALYVRSEVLREQLVVARPLSEGAPVRQITMLWRESAPRRDRFAEIAAQLRESLAPWDAAAGGTA